MVKQIANRIPTRKDSFLVFSTCVLFVHSWHTLMFLYAIDHLVLKANTFQIIGVYSYIIIFALLESITLFFIILLLCVLFPQNWFRNRFVYLGSSLAMLLTGFAILSSSYPFQYKSWIVIIYVLLIMIYCIYIIKRPIEKVQSSSLSERASVIAIMYLFIDLVALFIIFLRQVI